MFFFFLPRSLALSLSLFNSHASCLVCDDVPIDLQLAAESVLPETERRLIQRCPLPRWVAELAAGAAVLVLFVHCWDEGIFVDQAHAGGAG